MTLATKYQPRLVTPGLVTLGNRTHPLVYRYGSSDRASLIQGHGEWERVELSTVNYPVKQHKCGRFVRRECGVKAYEVDFINIGHIKYRKSLGNLLKE